MPKLYMLVGIPGSGKTTWVNNWMNTADIEDIMNTTIISSDDYIASYANSIEKTYQEVFGEYIKTATELMNADLECAIENDWSIIWDQTNTTAKTRASKLKKIPVHYEKIAVYFPTPDMNELLSRLDNRRGKFIPEHVIHSMIFSLTVPSIEEGFDEVITV